MISVYKPTIKRKDMDCVLTSMVAEEIGPGTLSHQLASKIGDYMDAYGGLAVSSYYNALLLSFDALGLGPGSAVAVSALSPGFYLPVLMERGLVPLVVDVDYDSCSVTEAEIDKVMPRNPAALLLHYHLGYAPDTDALARFGIPIIADISHALGGKKGDLHVGFDAHFAVISLDPENIITSAGGGLVMAPKKNNYTPLKDLREGKGRHLLLPDLNASLGLNQLRDIDALISRRKEIANVYSQGLMKSRHATFRQREGYDQPFFSFPVMLNSGMNDVRKYARRKNIETIPAFWDSIISVSGETYAGCENAKKILMRCLLFPLYPMLGNKNIDLVARILSTLP